MPESSVDVVHWWRHKNLRSLNLLMIVPLLSLFTQGYDPAISHGIPNTMILFWILTSLSQTLGLTDQ